MATSAESFYVFIKPKFQNQNFKSKFLKHVVNIAFEVNNHTLKKKLKKKFLEQKYDPQISGFGTAQSQFFEHWIIRISQFFELSSWFLESTLRNSFKLPRFFKLRFLEFPDFSNVS